MNWEAIGAVGELVGAAGVIASLAYLALQIRQNSKLIDQSNEVARANAAVVSGGHGMDFTRSIALDAEATRIWITGTSRPDALAPDEADRFDLLLVAQLIQMDVNYALLRGGTLDREVYDIWDRMLERWIRHPRFRRLWESGAVRSLTTDSFSALVNEKMEATG